MVKFDSFDSKQEHKQMTNKDSLLLELNYAEDDRDIAEALIQFMWAVDAVPADKENVVKWLSLECNKETNNWGVLPEKEQESKHD